MEVFAAWVSGYYNHGMTKDTLEKHTPATQPPPTITTMRPDEVTTSFSIEPTGPEGSDSLLINLAVGDLFANLRENAFYLENTPVSVPSAVDLAAVPLHYIWGDSSVYEVPWGALCLFDELEEARKQGRRIRNIFVTRLAGANHFVSNTSITFTCADLNLATLGRSLAITPCVAGRRQPSEGPVM